MKKLLSILMFISCVSVSQAQWNVLPPYTPPPYWLWNCGINPIQFGFVKPVGPGKIIYTFECWASPTSGGITRFYYSKADLTNVQAVGVTGSPGCCHDKTFALNDSVFCYAQFCCSGDGIYYTDNRYNTFSPFNVPVSNGSEKSVCITQNYIYGVFQTSIDSMRVFQYQRTGTYSGRKSNFTYDASINKLQFLNDSTGFSLATFKSNPSKTTIIKTQDFGSTWVPVIVDSVNPITDFHLLSNGKIYLCKQNGDVFYSNNAGNTWSFQSTVPSANYFAIRLMNDSSGYIGGSAGKLYKTVNYGISWTPEISNTTRRINEIYTFDSVAYFVDSLKYVYKNKSLIVHHFSAVSSSTSNIGCLETNAIATYSVFSSSGGPYTITVQSPTCTSSYTTTSPSTNQTFTFNCEGVYTLTAYDGINNQLGVKNYTVYPQSNTYDAPVTAWKDTICWGETDTLSFPITTPNYTVTSFLWNNLSTAMPLVVTPILVGTATYYIFTGVLTTGTKTCNLGASKTIIVNACVGINELDSKHLFKVYPNPVSSTLNIISPEKEFLKTEIEISNALGQIVLQTQFKSEIDVRYLSSGYYILKIITLDKGMLHYKFMKE